MLDSLKRLGRVGVMSAVLLVAFAPATPALAQASGTWAATGSMTTTADGATATLLQNGRVLLAGVAGSGRPAPTSTTQPPGPSRQPAA